MRFADTLALAVFVLWEIVWTKNLTRITVANYICSLEKLIKYAKAYKPSQIAGRSQVETPSSSLMSRYSEGHLHSGTPAQKRQKTVTMVTPDVNSRVQNRPTSSATTVTTEGSTPVQKRRKSTATIVTPEISSTPVPPINVESRSKENSESYIVWGLGLSELEGALKSFVNNDNTEFALQLNFFLEGMMYFKAVNDPALMGDFLILNDCQILSKLNSENFQMLAIV